MIVDFLTGAFSSPYYIGTMLNVASLLMIGACGAMFALVGGKMNLGGEGQIYLGGFVTAVVLKFLPAGNFSVLSVFIAALSAMLCSGGVALFSGIMFHKRGINELLTSFLVSAAIIPLIDSAITDSFRDMSGNLLATPFIVSSERFKQILAPSALNPSLFFILFVCIGFQIFLYKTTAGCRLRIWGISSEFAKYSGYSSLKADLGISAVSGMFHGLVGFLCVCGTYYTCHKGFYAGMGWNALSCALLARKNPIAIIPAALVLSWIYTSADRTALLHNFNFDISGIIQGIILFFIAIPVVIKLKRG